MEAIVLAGGAGTRLRDVVSDVPKSMAPIHGRPFLEYLLDYLVSQGIKRVTLSVGYKKECIIGHFGDQYRSVKLLYAPEEEPLGTGGGIRRAMRQIREKSCFVFNGDSLFLTGLTRLREHHLEHQPAVTMALRRLEDTSRYGRVERDPGGRITGFLEKKASSGSGYINAGVYLIEKEFLTGPLFPETFSLEKDCFEKYYRDHYFQGVPSEGYFIDIGIPSDYHKALEEFGKFTHR